MKYDTVYVLYHAYPISDSYFVPITINDEVEVEIVGVFTDYFRARSECYLNGCQMVEMRLNDSFAKAREAGDPWS